MISDSKLKLRYGCSMAMNLCQIYPGWESGQPFKDGLKWRMSASR